MPHQLLLKYLSSKTNFVFNQTLYTLFRETCRNDTSKLLLKTLLKELFTDNGEILSCKSIKPWKNWKTHGRITSEQEITPVQIPHPSNTTFKFPPPRARCTVKCPGYAPGGGGMLKFRIDRRILHLDVLQFFFSRVAWLSFLISKKVGSNSDVEK